MNTVVARLESRITPFLGDIHCHMTHKKFFPTSGGYISIHVCCTMHGCYCTGGDCESTIFLYGLEFLNIQYTMHYPFWISTLSLMCDILCISEFLIRAGIFKHSIIHALYKSDLDFEIFLYGLEFLNIQYTMHYAQAPAAFKTFMQPRAYSRGSSHPCRVLRQDIIFGSWTLAPISMRIFM